MEMPDYFDDGTGRVCKLLRSLYGLKQAPLIWNQTLDKRFDNRCQRFVGTDVNIELVLHELRAKFQIKYLGSGMNLLHMEVSYVPGQAL
ncbi:Gag-pol Polyprotein [Phytophthora megakarya]|uniref:Gag-pol Polyprotein n=1 Tax=Phytophthora megakarya TaxID=4795 RepID=A0A225VU73_9STRA|nr:Gag-pol Polyprotein [Phytophthora megakarya]